MSHAKSRSRVSVGQIDWHDPYISSLLEKTVDWRLDNRTSQPPKKVQIHLSSGWVTANTVSKPAVVVASGDGTMVLATRFPIQLGERVGVDSQRGDGTSILWGRVIEGREGRRAEDSEHDLFLSWLRLD